MEHSSSDGCYEMNTEVMNIGSDKDSSGSVLIINMTELKDSVERTTEDAVSSKLTDSMYIFTKRSYIPDTVINSINNTLLCGTSSNRGGFTHYNFSAR